MKKKLVVKKGGYYIDKDYTGTSGVTKESLKFWKEIKPHLGEIVKVEKTFNNKDWHRTIITDEHGTKVEFTGFASGYEGEGARGLAQLLRECRFDSRIAFEKESFTVKLI